MGLSEIPVLNLISFRTAFVLGGVRKDSHVKVLHNTITGFIQYGVPVRSALVES